MESLLEIQKKLMPDVLDVMLKRYQLLHHIQLMQPIGRRNLATNLQLSERIVRDEVTFLKEQGLLHFSTVGMYVTEEGEDVFYKLQQTMKQLQGLQALEKKLQHDLQVNKVIVVAGNSDRDEWVKRELGRATAQELKAAVSKDDVVAVMGGTTLATVAEMMSPDKSMTDVTFVPARGGLGERVENQANTISAELARRAQANYRLLHVPDQLSDEAYASLISEPSVREIVTIIESARIVLHGIGDAETMARRRNSVDLEKIIKNKAVGEAFGYYFDRHGSPIHKQKTIGMQLNKLDDKLVISVAGGHTKGKAIASFMKYKPSDILITDEGAAQALLNEM